MTTIHLSVAGESHGAGIVGILQGLPTGLPVDADRINSMLHVRQNLVGRGPRRHIESPRVQFLAGVRNGQTTGFPISFVVANIDSSQRSRTADGHEARMEWPRPGHADFAGAMKLGLTDATVVAESSSGRLTLALCVAGELCRSVLELVGTRVLGHVLAAGDMPLTRCDWRGRVNLAKAAAKVEASAALALTRSREKRILAQISGALERGETIGGVVEAVASPIPIGLGTCLPWEDRIDSRLGAALMGIPSVKAVEIGDIFDRVRSSGSEYHDGFAREQGRLHNRAGGLEGGMTNGEPLVVRLWVKPVPTTSRPMASRSLLDSSEGQAEHIRGDTCAVGPVAMAARAAVTLVLADALLSHQSWRTADEIRSRGHLD